MKETQTTMMIRIRASSLKRLMQVFPAMPKETMASYFSRLSTYLKEVTIFK